MSNNITVATDIVAAEGTLKELARYFARDRAAVFGFCLLVCVLLLAFVGPLIYPVDAFEIMGSPLSVPGSEGFLLGTDYLGRDVLAGLVHGARATLTIGSAAALCTVLIGVPIGALAGFYGRWVDTALMRVTEIFQVLPPLLFAMVLVSLFTPDLVTIALSIGLVSWTSIARLTRAEFLRIRKREFVTAARSCGATNGYLIWRVILPNAMPPLVVAATLSMGVAILFEAGLSFLGLSDPNVMSWGVMIGANRPFIFDAWWAVCFPGLAIFVTVLAVSLVGDGLTNASNPKLRKA